MAGKSVIINEERVDVVVVGGGNAGFSAVHSASDQGASVMLLEKAKEEEAGGNSFYTAGAFRITYDDIRDMIDVFDDELTVERLPRTVVPPYHAEDFTADMVRVTDGFCDPKLTNILVSRSAETLRWLHSKGLRFRLMFERQSFKKNDVWTFFGNLSIGTLDGGRGLIAQHTNAAHSAHVDNPHSARYGANMLGLLRAASGKVVGVEYETPDGELKRVRSTAVILAAGGFEADATRREKYLGAGWGKALVRGTPTNTGDVLEIALQAGAQRCGDWTTCHSVAWDAGGPPNGGNRKLTNQMTRQSYPLGIVVNVDGHRFVDEGADYRNYTYAKYGREILHQPGGLAFQLFDSVTRPMLRTEEYDSSPITCEQADTIEDLARKLGINAKNLRATVDSFNASIVDVPFNPAVKDGRAAHVKPPKSHWALELKEAPFFGYAVACGISFTFGGLKVDGDARAVDETGSPILGLYIAGEMVGGLFSGNYPGGSGLTSGAVFGRIAGAHAASMAGAR